MGGAISVGVVVPSVAGLSPLLHENKRLEIERANKIFFMVL